jgi:hypothetical protein
LPARTRWVRIEGGNRGQSGHSGELARPFHVVDDDMVVLPQDHPFAPGGRFASLLIRDRDLAEGLAIGFDGWSPLRLAMPSRSGG